MTTRKKVSLHFSVEPWIVDKLKEVAAEEHRNLSNMVEVLMIEALKDR